MSDAAGGPGDSISRPALRRCVRPSTRDDFAARVWSRQPLLSTREQLAGDGPAGFDDLFSLGRRRRAAVAARPAYAVPPDGQGRRRRAGRALHPRRRHRRAGRRPGGRRPGPGALRSTGTPSCCRVCTGLWPPLIDFAGELTTELGHPVQVNAYVTPQLVAGLLGALRRARRLRPAGRGREALADPRTGAARRRCATSRGTHRRAAVEARAAEEPVIDTVLRPGDALYLPRGYLHAAEALGDVSCHLTVGVHPVTRHARARGAARRSWPTTRRCGRRCRWVSTSATPLRSQADVRGHPRRAPDRPAAGRSPPPRCPSGWAARLVGSNRPEPVAPLAQAAALSTLAAESVLRRPPPPPAHAGHGRRRDRAAAARPDAAAARGDGEGRPLAARRRVAAGGGPARPRPGRRHGARPAPGARGRRAGRGACRASRSSLRPGARSLPASAATRWPAPPHPQRGTCSSSSPVAGAARRSRRPGSTQRSGWRCPRRAIAQGLRVAADPSARPAAGAGAAQLGGRQLPARARGVARGARSARTRSC